MFLKFLGFFWMMSGLLFMIKPLWMRRALQKKGAKKFRGILFTIAVTLGGALMVATWGKEGLHYTIIFIFGVVGLIKSFLFLNAGMSQKIFDWFENRSIQFLRGCAAVQCLFGIYLFFIR